MRRPLSATLASLVTVVCVVGIVVCGVLLVTAAFHHGTTGPPPGAVHCAEEDGSGDAGFPCTWNIGPGPDGDGDGRPLWYDADGHRHYVVQP